MEHFFKSHSLPKKVSSPILTKTKQRTKSKIPILSSSNIFTRLFHTSSIDIDSLAINTSTTTCPQDYPNDNPTYSQAKHLGLLPFKLLSSSNRIKRDQSFLMTSKTDFVVPFESKKTSMGGLFTKFFESDQISLADKFNLLDNYLQIVTSKESCKLYQKKLKQNVDYVNDKLFPVFLANFTSCAVHFYANYFVSLVIELLTPNNLIELTTVIRKNFVQICTVQQGSHVVQKYIMHLSNLAEEILVEFLMADHVKLLFMNQAVHYVGKQVIEKLSIDACSFIYKFIEENTLFVINSHYGCSLLRSCLLRNKAILNEIAECVCTNFDLVINDKKGSYVVSEIINQGDQTFIKRIIVMIMKRIEFCCTQKFSSQVVETVVF